MFTENNKLIVPMGGYTVLRKTQGNLIIVSPGVQSCVVIVLNSPHGVALAHIDSPFNAASTTRRMINELQSYGDGIVTGRLIGGDWGDLMFNSSPIYGQIYTALKSSKIKYTHFEYNLDLSLALSTIYAALWYFDTVSPESILGALLIVTLLYLAGKMLSNSSFDVYVNVSSGNVRTVKNNLKNTQQLLSEAERNLSNFNRFLHRAKLNPRNADNTEELKLIKIRPS